MLDHVLDGPVLEGGRPSPIALVERLQELVEPGSFFTQILD
jgi:hypothetical protein